MQSSNRNRAAIMLPRYVRILCLVTLLLLAGSALFELWISFRFWFRGEAFPAIAQGYRANVPELWDAVLPSSPLTWTATLLLDLLSFMPYYVALFSGALLFYRFYHGHIWIEANIRLLKYISALLIFDALFPSLKNTLQILLFVSEGGHHHLVAGIGLTSEGIRSFIVGFSVCVFSVVIDKARHLDDEIQLIV